jgi:Peptidase family M23
MGDGSTIGTRTGRSWGLTGIIAGAIALCCAVAATDATATTTALTAQTAGPARYVHANDGRPHVVYDLVLTNSFVGDVTLESLRVRAGKRVVQRLDRDELAAHTHKILDSETPVDTVAPSATVMVLMDVPLPRNGGPPRKLKHRLSYRLPEGLSSNAAIGTTTLRRPNVRVVHRKPTIIDPPLRGSGWWAGGGCCDPSQHHRGILLGDDGRYVTPEMFDIDWLRIAGGRIFTGQGTRLTDYPGYGAAVHSVADGKVVSATNDQPEAPLDGGPNPAVRKPADYTGNEAVIRIRPHRYAIYAHMQPGSVRVKRGDRVASGEVLGRVGNSGNSTAPHLHFGIHDGSFLATSYSLPWAFERYRYDGSGPLADDGTVEITGTPRRERRTYPLNLSSLTLFGAR